MENILRDKKKHFFIKVFPNEVSKQEAALFKANVLEIIEAEGDYRELMRYIMVNSPGVNNQDFFTTILGSLAPCLKLDRKTFSKYSELINSYMEERLLLKVSGNILTLLF